MIDRDIIWKWPASVQASDSETTLNLVWWNEVEQTNFCDLVTKFFFEMKLKNWWYKQNGCLWIGCFPPMSLKNYDSIFLTKPGLLVSLNLNGETKICQLHCSSLGFACQQQVFRLKQELCQRSKPDSFCHLLINIKDILKKLLVLVLSIKETTFVVN